MKLTAIFTIVILCAVCALDTMVVIQLGEANRELAQANSDLTNQLEVCQTGWQVPELTSN